MMKNFMATIGFIVLLLSGSSANADFVLFGTQHLKVNTPHSMDNGDLYLGGVLFDASRITVSDGSVGRLRAYNNSSIDIDGGSATDISTYDTSAANIYAGNGYGYLQAWDNSSVIVSGGGVFRFYAWDNSDVVISGGSIATLDARGNSNVVILGGNITHYLRSRDNSSATILGYDFRATDGLSLLECVADGNPQYKVIGAGLLTGKWQSGLSWAITISGDANIMAVPVPEPRPFCCWFWVGW